MTQKKETSALVRELKAASEDFEFYPTTDNMIDAVICDIKDNNMNYLQLNLLEIGCGDCRVGRRIMDNMRISEYHVIEKSNIHIQNLPNYATFFGADFNETSIINNYYNVIFCNPPYSEYEHWAANIIMNAYCAGLYLVIPKRWHNSELIKQAIKARGALVKVLLEDDFLEADRAARAKVEVIRIYWRDDIRFKDEEGKSDKYYIHRKSNDPFDIAFNDLFNFDELNLDEKEDSQTGAIAAFKQRKPIEQYVDCYNQDIERLINNYKAISKLDKALMNELGITDIDIIKKSIKTRIKSLKNDYWRKFIECYKPILERLTEKSRDEIYKRLLNDSLNIDFTVSNAYAMTILIIREVNNFTDSQIVDIFYKMADADNLINYKSNQKVFEKGKYRYNMGDTLEYYKNCKLDYRIVGTYFASSRWAVADVPFNIINDYLIVFKTLGFDSIFADKNDFRFATSETMNFYYKASNGEQRLLFDIKFYKKGTYHIRIAKEALLKLNIAIGLILGWIKTAEEAAEEMQEDLEDVKEAFEHIEQNIRIEFKPEDRQGLNNLLMLPNM